MTKSLAKVCPISCNGSMKTLAKAISEDPKARGAATIVVVERQRSYVDALRLALGITEDLRVVASEFDPTDALRRVTESKPSVVISGYQLTTDTNGLDLARSLREHEASQNLEMTPFLLLTAYPTPGIAQAARGLSSVSVMSKNLAITEVVSGLRSVVDGATLYAGVAEDPFGLSKAEYEVLELLATGLNATSIARDLHLSVHAIRARIRGLLTKTDSTSQLEAVVKALGTGVVAPPTLRPAVADSFVTAV